MRLWPSKYLSSARALIVQDGRLLVMHRKRFDAKTYEWIEYHSIPGGGIDKGEKPEIAVVRELREEMGVGIRVKQEVAHYVGPMFEHYIYSAELVDEAQIPTLMPDSEEALDWHTDINQFIPMWVDIDTLTEDNLHYYSHYLDIIRKLDAGIILDEVLQIDGR